MAVPIEPLLADPDLAPPGGVRMPRSVLPALFALVEPRLDPALRAEADATCRLLTTADIDAVQRLGRRLWPAAAAALAQAFVDPRGTMRTLAAAGLDAAAINAHYPTMLILLRAGEALAACLLPRDGRSPDPGAADAPHRALLLEAAESPASFRAIAAAFLLRAPSPDLVVRLIAQTRLALQRPALFDVVEEIVAALSAELVPPPERSGRPMESLAERRSHTALRLAMMLSELAGHGARLESLAAAAGQAMARQFGATLDGSVLAPLEALGAAGAAAGTARLAAIEGVARAAKRMELAGRAMGREEMFATAIVAARRRITALARRSSALADAGGAVALPDLVRLMEILAGPDEALAMVEQLAGEA
jgi:hypothetical protein